MDFTGKTAIVTGGARGLGLSYTGVGDPWRAGSDQRYRCRQ